MKLGRTLFPKITDLNEKERCLHASWNIMCKQFVVLSPKMQIFVQVKSQKLKLAADMRLQRVKFSRPEKRMEQMFRQCFDNVIK